MSHVEIKKGPKDTKMGHVPPGVALENVDPEQDRR
jgi:hypothetical protein